MSKIDKFISNITKQIGIDKKDELEQIWKKLETCPIILESGSRKNKVCGKICKKDGIRCSNHSSLHMCKKEECLHKCKENEQLCEYHMREQSRNEKNNRVFPFTRWEEPYFIIRDTNIIIDIAYHVIRGYKNKDNVCITEDTDEIQKNCKKYNISYVPFT
jgi:hypothetical protein